MPTQVEPSSTPPIEQLSAHVSRQDDAVVVRARSGTHLGWGEIPRSHARPYGAPDGGGMPHLSCWLTEIMADTELVQATMPSAITAALQRLENAGLALPNPVRMAILTALYDVRLRAFRLGLAEYLGEPHHRVPALTIPILTPLPDIGDIAAWRHILDQAASSRRDYLLPWPTETAPVLARIRDLTAINPCSTISIDAVRLDGAALTAACRALSGLDSIALPRIFCPSLSADQYTELLATLPGGTIAVLAEPAHGCREIYVDAWLLGGPDRFIETLLRAERIGCDVLIYGPLGHAPANATLAQLAALLTPPVPALPIIVPPGYPDSQLSATDPPRLIVHHGNGLGCRPDWFAQEKSKPDGL